MAMKTKKFLSRDQLLESIRTQTKEKELPGLGLVKYRNLTFSEQQRILVECNGDNQDYAIKCIIAGFIEPKFEASDMKALKDGAFGTVASLARLPLEDLEQGHIRAEDLGK